MSANTRRQYITDDRVVEIIRVIIQHFGPMGQYEILAIAQMIGSDRFRRVSAGLVPPPKKLPPIYDLGPESWNFYIGAMIHCGSIERIDGKIHLVREFEIDADDLQRCREYEMIKKRQAVKQSDSEGGGK